MTMRVGIERINAYPTTLALTMDDLCASRGFDAEFVRNGLGVDERGVNPPWEDVVTMAVNAANPMLANSDRNEIGLLIVGTESGVDQEKPISSWVHRYLGLASHCRNFEVKHACYGTTAGVQLALSWLTSGIAGNQKALLINTDQSVIALAQPYEPVTGAGAVAILLSASPRLAAYELDHVGVYAAEVADVFRPTPRVETGNSELSLFSYLDALEHAYAAYVAAAPAPIDFDIHFDWHVYHMPFPGMAIRAHRTLLAGLDGLSKTDTLAHFRRKCEASTSIIRRMGGIYGASTFVGLLGLVQSMDAVRSGDRVGVFAYGSGSCAEYFSMTLLQEAKDVVQKSGLSAALNTRRHIDVTTYEALEIERDASVMARDYRPSMEACEAWFSERYEGQGLLVLDRVEDYYRHYRWS